MTNQQIILSFENSFIYINKVETKGRENNMICVMYRDYPLYFPTYYAAYDYFKRKNII
jgi:hypothetical protein